MSKINTNGYAYRIINGEMKVVPAIILDEFIGADARPVRTVIADFKDNSNSKYYFDSNPGISEYYEIDRLDYGFWAEDCDLNKYIEIAIKVNLNFIHSILEEKGALGSVVFQAQYSCFEASENTIMSLANQMSMLI